VGNVTCFRMLNGLLAELKLVSTGMLKYCKASR
jgi:hypothetical protein